MWHLLTDIVLLYPFTPIMSDNLLVLEWLDWVSLVQLVTAKHICYINGLATLMAKK